VHSIRTYNKRNWESWFKFNEALNVLDMVLCERNRECFYILEEIFNFATSYDREDICSLLHHVCYGDCEKNRKEKKVRSQI